LFDETYRGEGIKISAILPGGPIDKADSKVKEGDLITAINGETITENENWNKYLSNLTGKNTRLTFKRNGSTFDKTIKPESLAKQQNRMYKRWIKKMEELTVSLSDGQLGYVHIQGMNDGSYRDVYENVMGKNVD